MRFRLIWVLVSIACLGNGMNPVVKITLNSDDILEHCKIQKLANDSLTFSFLSNEQTESHLAVDDIKSIVYSRESEIIRIRLAELSHAEKINQLTAIFSHGEAASGAYNFPERPFYTTWQFQLFILLSAGLLIFIAIIMLQKYKKKPLADEPIPGVEEMAKTLFFWSDYHRGENRDD